MTTIIDGPVLQHFYFAFLYTCDYGAEYMSLLVSFKAKGKGTFVTLLDLFRSSSLLFRPSEKTLLEVYVPL